MHECDVEFAISEVVDYVVGRGVTDTVAEGVPQIVRRRTVCDGFYYADVFHAINSAVMRLGNE